MTHEVAIKWLKMQSSKPVKWDDYSEESREIREAAEQHMKEAFNMAIDALKAQEPIKPKPDTSLGARPWWIVCGNCKLSINEDYRYCPYCGRAVKWE